MDLGLTSRPRRRPSLTPMIDVVFLLLVFFMLASRFGMDQVVEMPIASGGGDASGAPKLVDILPEELRLNGISLPLDRLVAELKTLVETPQDTIVLRSLDEANVQRIIAVSEALQAAGFKALVLVE
ncbi:protein TolR [Thalassovita autumnalis]|uniref:Protein TolR n=1 Tax=Thalassovita autumnalis TaxID=2072972 RepID=A0A0P1FLV4_9RHOB|nr:biopolymer transporter ExbD [Thalassovita autumnalis]CUH69215.1 protein TolR [Thalassovita autumnalis]CUH73582.1 protein TolR [Thalassovita autumnalis]